MLRVILVFELRDNLFWCGLQGFLLFFEIAFFGLYVSLRPEFLGIWAKPLKFSGGGMILEGGTRL